MSTSLVNILCEKMGSTQNISVVYSSTMVI